MGQSNSRNRQPEQVTRRRSMPASTSMTTTTGTPLSSTTERPTAPQAKPPSSFRNSVASLIRHGAKREATDSQHSETVKRSWRGSRIFPKASRKPFVSSPTTPENLPAASSTEYAAQPEASSSAQIPDGPSQFAAPLSTPDTRTCEVDASSDALPSPRSHDPALSAPSIAVTASQSHSGTNEREVAHPEEASSSVAGPVPLAHRLGLSGTSDLATEEEDHSNALHATLDDEIIAAQDVHTGSVHQPAQPAPLPGTTVPSRSFPPPGTLVLVQGVVQTTDVPRASTSPDSGSAAAEASSATPRSRPSSMGDPTSGSAWASRSAPRPSSMSAVPSHILSNAGEEGAPSPASTAPQSADPRTPSTAISSSSIDVLGTLLSVAAAATAASLLTGSAAGSTLNPSNSLNSPLAAPSPPLNEFGQTARRERMRQAWGSLRERLGLRAQSNSPLSPHSASTTPVRHPTDPVTGPMDAREMMLTEMARAFNMGLGLDSHPSEQSSQRSSTSPPEDNASTNLNPDSSTNGEMDRAAEGTFDRFLEDLQTDLRVMLTGHGMSIDVDDGEDQSESEESAEGEGVENDDASSTTPSQAGVPDYADEEGLSELGPEPQPASTYHSPPTSPTATLDNIGEQGSNTGPPRNVNWWRTYRFSPISTRGIAGTVDPHEGRVTSSQASTDNPTPDAASSQPSPPISSPLSTSPTDAHSTPLHAPNTQSIPGPSTDIVYPVIVVGLRSVGTARATRRQSAAVPSAVTSMFQETAPGPTNTEAPAEPLLDDAENSTSREGGWRQRAATAVRNLRSPGGRSGESSEPAATPDEPGSRTFLIFVIGGYYPPGHSMVVGGPDTLNSFEALLELTELLGQVKSSTASKEDIENSGLQIIKASALKLFEEQGKVTSNCVDRCLICLDEYVADDDVRLMSCRHGFHQTCVDRWLETGKNSCPACRSKGVPTSGVDSANPPSTRTSAV